MDNIAPQSPQIQELVARKRLWEKLTELIDEGILLIKKAREEQPQEPQPRRPFGGPSGLRG